MSTMTKDQHGRTLLPSAGELERLDTRAVGGGMSAPEDRFIGLVQDDDLRIKVWVRQAPNGSVLVDVDTAWDGEATRYPLIVSVDDHTILDNEPKQRRDG